MSSRLGARSTRALFAYKDEFFAVVAGAILLTIIGDTVIESLTTSSFWHLPRVLWRIALFIIALVLLYFGTAWLAKILEARRSKVRPDINIEAGVTSTPALVLFVSTNRTGPYRVIVDRLVATSAAPQDKLKRVFLIHSRESKEVATEFKSELEERQLEAVEVGLQADFADLQSTRNTVLQAIAYAQSDPKLGAITVDITGGSGLCTAGAVLARMEKEFNLTYIRPVPGEKLSDGILQQVSVDWIGGGLFSRLDEAQPTDV